MGQLQGINCSVIYHASELYEINSGIFVRIDTLHILQDGTLKYLFQIIGNQLA